MKICPPTLAPFVWPCPWPLDLGLLNQAAAAILGTHDFTSFSAADPDLAIRSPQPNVPATRRSPPSLSRTQLLEAEPAAPQALKNPIRTVFQSLWHAEGELLVYRVTATSFLHHMVRNLVGTFVQCGARRLPPHAIPEIVAACSRSAAGPTAPASGLFLLNVEYPAQHLAHPPEGEPAP